MQLLSGLWALVGVLASRACASPAYQIDVTQKGFTQFVEYDVMVPPLSEFTFCMRLRTVDLARHQPIFTYLVNGNEPLIGLWLESGGGNLHTRLGGPAELVEQVTPVDWPAGVWRQLCLSWQSDVGAWALYQDGQILACAASQKLIGYIFPGGGRILIGYGLSDNTGSKSGLEGNVYDFNMILSSTIARNHSIKLTSQLMKMPYKKRIEQNNFKSFIIGDLDADNTNEILESDINSHVKNSKKGHNHIKFTTPDSRIEHEVGLDLKIRPPFIVKLPSKFTEKTNLHLNFNNESEIFDVHSFKAEQSLPEQGLSRLWKIINKSGIEGKFRTAQKNHQELTKSGTEENPVLSEFETPPPPNNPLLFEMLDDDAYQVKPLKIKEPQARPMITEYNKNRDEKNYNVSFLRVNPEITTPEIFPTISEIETPPNPERDEKVYGHWAGNTFAGAVFEYLKKQNFKNKPVPRTIPLGKITDDFPYASEQSFQATIPFKLALKQKTNRDKMLNVLKRYIRSPEINVKIMGESIRNIIAQQHSTERAVNVEVFHRGEVPITVEQYNEQVAQPRYHQLKIEKESDENYPEPFRLKNHNFENKHYDDIFFFGSNDKEGLTLKEKPSGSSHTSLKSRQGEKWQAIQSFNNDFTTRHDTFLNSSRNFEDSSFSDNLNQQSLPRLFYQHSPYDARERELNKNIAIAYEVSKRANTVNATFPYFVINNNAIPMTSSSSKRNRPNKTTSTIKAFRNSNITQNPFYKSVKLGNALNELHIIGNNIHERKKSFIGGDDSIPDINRHRSDIDGDINDDKNKTPPSLGPRVCKQIFTAKNKLYVQADGSIDLTQIHPKLKSMSPGLQLLKEHYTTNCSSVYSHRQNQHLMLIQWKHTPVRIFGGGKLRRKPDVCNSF